MHRFNNLKILTFTSTTPFESLKPLTINNKNKTHNQTLYKSIRCFHSLDTKRPKEKPFLADLLCSLHYVLFLLGNRTQTCPHRFLPTYGEIIVQRERSIGIFLVEEEE